LATRTCINLVSRVLAHTFEFSVSRSRSSPHNLLPRVPLGRFAGLKHRQLARRVGDRRRLLRLRRASGCLGTSCGPSRGSSCRSSSTTPPRVGSSSTTSPPPHVRVPRHAALLVTQLVAPLLIDYSTSRLLIVDNSASRRLVVDYFASAARPGASTRRAARHAARRAARCRLLRLAQSRRGQLRVTQARR
jgi:hypothetical protein